MLTLSEIRDIAAGAVEIYEENGEYSFLRFEGEAREYYSEVGRSTAGILLDFVTDSDRIAFNYRCIKRVDRSHSFFDIYENGVLIGHSGKCFDEGEKEFSGRFESLLSSGEKRIMIYFPNLAEGRISELDLSEVAYAKRSEKKKSLLMMGDSITHGYDAYYPSLSYANTVARELDCETVNQAVGGEMFTVRCLPSVSSLQPDYITVAYGTNDWSWSHKTLEECRENAVEYFKKLRGLYPESEIFYISPLYRADNSRITEVGDLAGAVRCFSAVAESLGCSVINGEGLIPHHKGMFEDGYLHPNDLGFTQYANALLKELRKRGVN